MIINTGISAVFRGSLIPKGVITIESNIDGFIAMHILVATKSTINQLDYWIYTN